MLRKKETINLFAYFLNSKNELLNEYKNAQIMKSKIESLKGSLATKAKPPVTANL